MAQAAQRNVIAGTVVARATGAAVPGAVVTVEGTSTTAVTSGTGRFVIDNAPAGPVALSVEAPGFVRQRLTDVRAGGDMLAIALDATPNFMERVQVTATKTPLEHRRRRRAGQHRRARDDRDARRPDADPGDRQRARRRRQHAARPVRERLTARAAARRQRVHQHLLLIDGVPQANSGNSARVVGLTINDASSIEVVRGPNSALVRPHRDRRLGEPENGGSDASAPGQRRVHRRRVRDAQGRSAACPGRSATGAATTSRSARSRTAATSRT